MSSSVSTRRTVSGTAVGIGFLVVAALVVGFVVFVAPALQRDAASLLGPERDVIDAGELAGTPWTVAATTGEDGTCLVVELAGAPVDQTCARIGEDILGEVVVGAPADGGGYVLAGVTAPDVPLVRVQLDRGESPLPRVRRPRGFPEGFFVTTVAPGATVERLAAIGTDERELAARSCDGPLATAEGAGTGCQTGGQG